MADDPVLDFLLAAERSTAEAHDAARAALAAYRGDAPAEPTSDFVSLKDAMALFRKSYDTVRRWAAKEGLGSFVGGKWYLSRALVIEHRFAGSMPLHFAGVTASPAALL